MMVGKVEFSYDGCLTPETSARLRAHIAVFKTQFTKYRCFR